MIKYKCTWQVLLQVEVEWDFMATLFKHSSVVGDEGDSPSQDFFFPIVVMVLVIRVGLPVRLLLAFQHEIKALSFECLLHYNLHLPFYHSSCVLLL